MMPLIAAYKTRRVCQRSCFLKFKIPYNTTTGCFQNHPLFGTNFEQKKEVCILQGTAVIHFRFVMHKSYSNFSGLCTSKLLQSVHHYLSQLFQKNTRHSVLLEHGVTTGGNFDKSASIIALRRIVQLMWSLVGFDQGRGRRSQY